jgi:hypothetical protein
MTVTIDGPQKLLDILRLISDNEDKLNALSGVGMVLRTGIVLSSLPEVTVAMDGESSLGGPMIFDEAKGDLLVPEDILLTRGDTVAMAPLSKRRWVIMFKTRTSIEEIYRARFGLNRDRAGGEFAGLEVTMDPNTGEVHVNIVGASTNIGGGDVFVNDSQIAEDVIVGPPGPAGPLGPAGPTGPASTIPGPAGPAGPAGAQGNPGPTGLTGSAGGTGPAGPPGERGFEGPKGDVGSQGNVGPQGAQGIPGPVGPTGPSSVGAHEEFVPINGATVVTLASKAVVLLTVAKNGVVLTDALDYELTGGGTTVTFTTPFNGSQRLVVAYAAESVAGVDAELRLYVQRMMLLLDPDGTPPPAQAVSQGITVDNELRTYIASVMATLDPGGPPPPV